jgi:hypothetical protein
LEPLAFERDQGEEYDLDEDDFSDFEDELDDFEDEFEETDQF